MHEGTQRYEIGNTNLKPETSLQFDVAITAETKTISTELDVFYNRIDDFIYYRNFNGENILTGGNQYPVYRYIQGNAELYGLEFAFDVHPFDPLHLENNVSLVRATNLQTHVPLPFIPAARIQNNIRYNFGNSKKGFLKETFVKIGFDNYLKQDRYDSFETATGAYTLLNAGVGGSIKIGRRYAVVFINGNNLTNKKYFNHLSRFKEVGIYNKGRNFNISVSIPFNINSRQQ